MSSDRSHKDHLQEEEGQKERTFKREGIGAIFQEYGEAYIKGYKPTYDVIKFIRSVRLCKTPALGGKILGCKKCGYDHYIYFSCGNARCPLCQSIKTEQWADKLNGVLLAVPYIHLVTSLPRELRRLARSNEKVVYNLLFAATKATIWKIVGSTKEKKSTPGMVSVLHTWGSDLKYHPHVHSLVTFGWMDDEGKWQSPKHKSRLCKNSKLRFTFREQFLRLLKIAYSEGKVNYHLSYEELIKDIRYKSWNVKATHPTMNSEAIENYLARYINRIAVSKSRVKYVKELREVHLIYNDYKSQEEGEIAPKELEILGPLEFINQLVQHLPPPYYQRTRYYGLHGSSKSEKTKRLIEQKARNHPRAIRTVFEIMTHLMKLEPMVCEQCGGEVFETKDLRPNKAWILQYITLPATRSP